MSSEGKVRECYYDWRSDDVGAFESQRILMIEKSAYLALQEKVAALEAESEKLRKINADINWSNGSHVDQIKTLREQNEIMRAALELCNAKLNKAGVRCTLAEQALAKAKALDAILSGASDET